MKTHQEHRRTTGKPSLFTVKPLSLQQRRDQLKRFTSSTQRSPIPPQPQPKMMSARRNPVIATGIIGATLASIGYFVAEVGEHAPVGGELPKQKDRLREEGAQGETVRAGKETPQEAVNDVGLERHGGDKGMKEVKAK
ncbi:MAG: hypothetical protein M1831_004194 [Alyxoria varia]|nr:MAG: hypothetical protein M1831_004194 [Alyxoria varia]